MCVCVCVCVVINMPCVFLPLIHGPVLQRGHGCSRDRKGGCCSVCTDVVIVVIAAAVVIRMTWVWIIPNKIGKSGSRDRN